MKTIRIKLILIYTILLLSCEKHELTILKRGNIDINSLKLDGYYSSKSNYILGVVLLYQNGVMYIIGKQDDGISKEELEQKIYNLNRNNKYSWGVFTLLKDSISIEILDDPAFKEVRLNNGFVINDTTFVINRIELYNRRNLKYYENVNDTFTYNYLYEKPDSSNNFIK